MVIRRWHRRMLAQVAAITAVAVIGVASESAFILDSMSKVPSNRPVTGTQYGVAIQAKADSEGDDVIDSETYRQILDGSFPDVLMVFNDESEREPFSGHNTMLYDYSLTPEWSIPDEYKENGGCFPKSVQTYLRKLCLEYDISYPVMVALVEAESSYKCKASSPDGECVGYAMINPDYHADRMEDLGVDDLYDPYGNLAVAVDFLGELIGKYGDIEYALICYNCGETGAATLASNGITSTAYSRKVLRRAEEIADEMGY